MEDTVQICFGLHDKDGTYSYNVGAVMRSIMEHTQSKVCFYILLDESVTEENIERLKATAHQNGARILIMHVDSNTLGNEEIWDRFTSGAMMRLASPEVLHFLKRVIYLDADILVNRDIVELWNMDISNYALAAVVAEVVHPSVPEIPDGKYFNSGVLLLNLERIRKDGSLLERGLQFLKEHPKDRSPDQDAINHLYWKETLLIDDTWNTFVDTVNHSLPEKRIYHFVGTKINLLKPNFYDVLLENTIVNTPWGFESLVSQYEHEIWVGHDRLGTLHKLARQLSSKNKIRIYHGLDWSALNGVKEFCPPRDCDFYLLSENNAVYPSYMENKKDMNVLDDMNKDDYIIITAPVLGFDLKKFKELNLVEDKDFFNALWLVDRTKAGYL